MIKSLENLIILKVDSLKSVLAARVGRKVYEKSLKAIHDLLDETREEFIENVYMLLLYTCELLFHQVEIEIFCQDEIVITIYDGLVSSEMYPSPEEFVNHYKQCTGFMSSNLTIFESIEDGEFAFRSECRFTRSKKEILSYVFLLITCGAEYYQLVKEVG